jgi:hypothetical protein
VHDWAISLSKNSAKLHIELLLISDLVIEIVLEELPYGNVRGTLAFSGLEHENRMGYHFQVGQLHLSKNDFKFEFLNFEI